jgi:hypothetical protein
MVARNFNIKNLYSMLLKSGHISRLMCDGNKSNKKVMLIYKNKHFDLKYMDTIFQYITYQGVIRGLIGGTYVNMLSVIHGTNVVSK